MTEFNDLFEQTIDEDLFNEVNAAKTPRSGQFAAVVKRLKWGTFPDWINDVGGKPRAAVTFDLYDNEGERIGSTQLDVTPVAWRTKNDTLRTPTQAYYLIAAAAGLAGGTSLVDAFTEKAPGAVIYLWGKEQVKCTVDDLPETERESRLDKGDKPSDTVYYDINDGNRDWFTDQGFVTMWTPFTARAYTGNLFRDHGDNGVVDENEIPF